MFKRRRLLGLKVTPPAKSGANAAPTAEAMEAREKNARPPRAPSSTAPGTWGRALKGLPGQGRP